MDHHVWNDIPERTSRSVTHPETTPTRAYLTTKNKTIRVDWADVGGAEAWMSYKSIGTQNRGECAPILKIPRLGFRKPNDSPELVGGTDLDLVVCNKPREHKETIGEVFCVDLVAEVATVMTTFWRGREASVGEATTAAERERQRLPYRKGEEPIWKPCEKIEGPMWRPCGKQQGGPHRKTEELRLWPYGMVEEPMWQPCGKAEALMMQRRRPCRKTKELTRRQ
ncbi:hypothetical protein ACLOJK_006646 [Asimina triloba]